MGAEVKSVVYDLISKYKKIEEPTVSDSSELIENIFKHLNTNGNDTLDNDDKMNASWKQYFGIDENSSISKSDLENKIDDIACNVMEGTKIEEDYSYDYRTSEQQQEDNKNAEANGKKLFRVIFKENDAYDYDEVNDLLNSVNKDNVINFIKGYNSAKNNNWLSIVNPEGIIEALDDEWDNGAISMDAKRNLVNSLLEAAKAKGLEKDPSYKKIENIMKHYNKDGSLSDKDGFDNRASYSLTAIGGGALAGAGGGGALGFAVTSWSGGWGAIIGGLIGAAGGATQPTNDSERLDDAITALVEKM